MTILKKEKIQIQNENDHGHPGARLINQITWIVGVYDGHWLKSEVNPWTNKKLLKKGESLSLVGR
jgi:hypothetical protein